MSQYYFAVASLPSLKSGEKPPLTRERFEDIARSALSEADLAVFEKALLGQPSETENSFLQEWFTWEKEFKKELAKGRLQKAGFENPGPLPETLGKFNLMEAARSLLGKDNPLEAEMLLDAVRWSFLEEMLLGHYFDLEVILAYSLKMQILQRQDLFEKTLGQENYRKTYQTIIDTLELNPETNRESV